MRGSRRGNAPYYFIIAGVALQATSPVLTKLLLQHLSSATLVGTRYAFAVLALLPFGLTGTRDAAAVAKPRPRDWVALLLVGILGSGLGALAFTAAINLSSAGVANAISKSGPLLVAFLAFLTLRERSTPLRLVLVAVVVVADLLLGWGEVTVAGGLALAGSRLLGVALALAAGTGRALSEILAKSALRHFPAAVVSFWRFAAGLLLAGTVSVATGGFRDLADVDLTDWLLLGLLGIVATALSMSLYYRGAARVPTHVAATIKVLGTIATATLAWAVLGENLNGYHIAGIGLVVAGGCLLVARTRAVPGRVPVAARAARRRKAASHASLRTRMAVFTSIVVVTTVFPLTYLAIRHTTQVVTEQTRLVMGRVATMIVQLAGLPEMPPPAALQQYMDAVVGTQIEGDLYTIDVVYAALVNENGNIIALSLNRRVMLVNSAGVRVQASQGEVARQFLDLAATGQLSQEYDVVPVTAQIVRDGKPVYSVKMGCKRSIANQAIAEIVARMGALAFLIAGIGIVVSTHLIGKITRPLEVVSRAVARVSAGERDVAVVAAGDEQSEVIARALGLIVADLRSADAIRDELIGTLVAQATRARACGDADGAVAVASDGPSADSPIVLVAQIPPVLFGLAGADAANSLRAFVDSFVASAHAYEGVIDGCYDGLLVACWGTQGEEADDPLRAALSALDLQAIAEETGVACLQAVTRVPASATGTVDSRAVEKLWADLFGRDGPSDAEGEIIATEQVYEAVAQLVRAEPRAEGLPGYRILPGEPNGHLGQAAVGGED